MVNDKKPPFNRENVAALIANAIVQTSDRLTAEQESPFFEASKIVTAYALFPLFELADATGLFDKVNSYLKMAGCPPMQREPDGDQPTVRLY